MAEIPPYDYSYQSKADERTYAERQAMPVRMRAAYDSARYYWLSRGMGSMYGSADTSTGDLGLGGASMTAEEVDAAIREHAERAKQAWQPFLNSQKTFAEEQTHKFLAQQQQVEDSRGGLLTPWVRDALEASGAASGILLTGIQTTLSFIPVVGQILNIAITGAIALANGERLDAAMIKAIGAALPGGPLVQKAFGVAVDILSGKPIEEIGINLLPIPEPAKQVLYSVARVTRALAEGNPVGAVIASEAIRQLAAASQVAIEQAAKLGAPKMIESVIAEVEKTLPPEARQTVIAAIRKGVAVSEALQIQNAVANFIKASNYVSELRSKGRGIIAANKLLDTGYAMIPYGGGKGYEVGAALMSAKISQIELIATRETLNAAERKAFDMAVAIYIGIFRTEGATTPPKAVLQTAVIKGGAADPTSLVAFKKKVVFETAVRKTGSLVPTQDITTKPVMRLAIRPNGIPLPSSAAEVGYLIAQGMRGASEAQRVGVLSELAADTQAWEGVGIAIKQGVNGLTWFERLLAFFGLN